MTERPVMLKTPDAIAFAQLAAWKGACRLEALGMKHSSGRSVIAHVKRVFGLKRSMKPAEVVAFLTQKVEEAIAAKQAEVQQ